MQLNETRLIAIQFAQALFQYDNSFDDPILSNNKIYHRTNLSILILASFILNCVEFGTWIHVASIFYHPKTVTLSAKDVTHKLYRVKM